MKKAPFQKLIPIIFVLLLLLPGCQADDGMVTVYCLTDVERTSDFGETLRPPVTFSYDENGNLLEVQRIDETISERWLYTYDSRSNLIASEYFAGGAPAGKSTYAYDEADRLIAKQRYGSDATLLESQHFAYDQNGNKKSSLTVDEITKMRTLLHYFYDENGTCVSIQKGRFEGHMSAYVDWIYDENGRLLEERTAANDGLDCVYTYNDKGWLLSRTIGNGFRGEYVYTHDQNGNIITETFGTKTEAPYHRQSFSYDRKGRIIEQILFNPDGTESLRNAYSYDRFGKILSIEQISGSSRHSCELSYDKTVTFCPKRHLACILSA